MNGYSEMDGSTRIRRKMVEALYENTKGRVVVGSGMSNAFRVTIGLRQGSGLIPLLFILVMELISRCSAKDDYERKRSCDRCRASGRIVRRTGRVE